MVGKELLKLSKKIPKVASKDKATQRKTLLAAFHTEPAQYLKERTYALDSPLEDVFWEEESYQLVVHQYGWLECVPNGRK